MSKRGDTIGVAVADEISPNTTPSLTEQKRDFWKRVCGVLAAYFGAAWVETLRDPTAELVSLPNGDMCPVNTVACQMSKDGETLAVWLKSGEIELPDNPLGTWSKIWPVTVPVIPTIGKALVVGYQFWRGAGYGLKDISGNQLNLTVNGGSETYQDLRSYGNGLTVHTQYFRCETLDSKLQPLGDFSACVVFQLASLPDVGKSGTLISIDGPGSGTGNALFCLTVGSDGKLSTGIELDDGWHGYNSSAVVATDVLYHVTLARKSNRYYFYVNGVLIDDDCVLPAPQGGSAAKLCVGGVPYPPVLENTYLDGALSSLYFFACGLTADDVQLLYRDEVLRWGARPGGGGAPSAHASTHQPGGSDAMAVDAAAATGSLRTLGTSATQACAGNDTRLSNARTPTAHASSHGAGQSDALSVTEAMLSLTDNTTGDAGTDKHGLAPKRSGNATDFLGGDGGYHALPDASTGALVTLYEKDLSTLAAQDLKTGGDGAKTIDGKTWYLYNSANATTAYLNDGSHAGLYIRANGNSPDDWNQTTTLPRVVVSLATLTGKKVQEILEWWVWVMFSQPHTPNANYEYGQIGIQEAPFSNDTTTTYRRFIMARGYGNGLGVAVEYHSSANTQSSPSATQPPATTDDVYAYRILQNGWVEAYAGQSSAGAWPARSALKYIASCGFKSLLTGMDTLSIYGTGTGSNSFGWALTMGMKTGNALGLGDILMKKLKVEGR